MSCNTVFPPGSSPENEITRQILDHPRIVYEVTRTSFVIAIRDELLVRRSVLEASPTLARALEKVARSSGKLGGQAESERGRGGSNAQTQPPTASDPGDVELWHITDPTADSIDVARRLRRLAKCQCCAPYNGFEWSEPPVSPNHVAVLCSKNDVCPASPPEPAPPPPEGEDFVPQAGEGPCATVVVIDSGYFEGIHPRLDARVRSVAGWWLDSTTGIWMPDPPDQLDAGGDGVLDGIAGHGTFNAGLVAHICSQVEIRVVGERHDITQIGTLNQVVEQQLFSSEFDVANAIWTNSNADVDVISCGFAFPTLDDYPSIPFNAVMTTLRGPESPRPGIAVVAPAGNEDRSTPYWPAAHPDVVGVAATNRLGNARAHFSNWGAWCDCCTRGEYVRSTYIDWDGPVQGEPPGEIEHFAGWARWDGTSFAAPKVAAAIACLVAASDEDLLPLDAWELLVGGLGGVPVNPLTGNASAGPADVTLPHLQLG